MKKIISFAVGFFCYTIAMFILNGWDNMTTHQQLNSEITSEFLSRASNSSFAGGKFKNYSFNWDGSNAPQLAGPEYSQATSENLLFTPQNVTISNKPIEWITKGGWMEDVPWGPSALRHFYDPLAIDGATYLTDRSSKLESLLSPVLSWASVSAKDWATHNENQYSWTKAKSYVIQALKEKNQDLRKQDMAQAYRCLGQIMHLLADMGCPPHVRNDSHPPNAYCIIGDPDPTETLTALLNAGTIAAGGVRNSNLSNLMGSSEQMGNLFDLLAGYVNGRFFSNQTISTDRFNPVIRPTKPYPNPYLTETDYNYSDHTYYKTYENGPVKMCKDLHPVGMFMSVFTAKDSIRGIPYIDMECVQSQVATILPNVAEAGVNLIRMFVPSLKINLTDVKADSGGIVRGNVAYTIPSFNDEYSGLFDLNNIYNGVVSIYVNNSKISATATASGNKFEIKLQNPVTLKENDVVHAEIEFGGIVLKSDDSKATSGETLLQQLLKTKLISEECNFNYTNQVGYATSEQIEAYTYYPKDSVKWTGNGFSLNEQTLGTFDSNGFKDNYYMTVTGTAASDAKSILDITYEYKVEYYSYMQLSSTQTIKMTFTNIPLTRSPGYQDWGSGTVYNDFVFELDKAGSLSNLTTNEWHWSDNPTFDIVGKDKITSFSVPVKINFQYKN